VKPRERVLRAFRRLEGLPDRVPIQFDLCTQLLAHFAQKLDLPLHYTRNLFEDVTYRISGNEIRTALGSDVVLTGASEISESVQKLDDGTWYNEYGMRMRQGEIYVEIVTFPLAEVQTAFDIKAYAFPDPLIAQRYADAAKIVNQFKDSYLVIADIEVTIFSLAQELVGMEKLLIDMASGAEYVQPLFRACADFQTQVGLKLIECGVDALWVGDDFGSQNGLLISPQMFRQSLKPHYARMNQAFKSVNPDILLLLHSDGAVSPVLEDVVELGYEVFNPLQPGVPGHSPEDLKNGFGDRLCFWGGIDQQQLLPHGFDAELEATIRKYIEILGAGGGYMISPAHIIQADVTPERVETFVALSKRYGRYE